jgi:hypothetical protein
MAKHNLPGLGALQAVLEHGQSISILSEERYGYAGHERGLMITENSAKSMLRMDQG